MAWSNLLENATPARRGKADPGPVEAQSRAGWPSSTQRLNDAS